MVQELFHGISGAVGVGLFGDGEGHGVAAFAVGDKEDLVAGLGGIQSRSQHQTGCGITGVADHAKEAGLHLLRLEAQLGSKAQAVLFLVTVENDLAIVRRLQAGLFQQVGDRLLYQGTYSCTLA